MKNKTRNTSKNNGNKIKATKKQQQSLEKLMDALNYSCGAYHRNEPIDVQIELFHEVGECFIAYAKGSNGFILKTEHYSHISTIQELDEVEPLNPNEFTDEGMLKHFDYIILVLHFLCSSRDMNFETRFEWYEKAMVVAIEMMSIIETIYLPEAA